MHGMVSPTDDDGHAIPPGSPPIRDRRVLRVQRLNPVWSCVPCPGGYLGRGLSDSRRALLRAASGLDRESVPAAASPLLRCPDGGRGVEGPRVAICRRGDGGPLGHGLGPSTDPKPDHAPLERPPVLCQRPPPSTSPRG